MPTFKVPVSFHVFNRPELTARVFEAIRAVQPKYLFVTADGPRKGHPEDIDRCRDVRRIIDENIDWDCELSRNYSEGNIGSYRCTSDGISRVFESVGEAIILEDDCLPDISFFKYCEQLLDRYRDDERVSIISGNNFLRDLRAYPYSYYYSKYLFTWGWATWRRTWSLFNHEMKGWPEYRDFGGLQSPFDRKGVQYHWCRKFEDMHTGKSSQHWDRKLFLATLMENLLSVNPRVNLVSNIGAGAEGTNVTRADHRHNLPTESMAFPLVHPAHTYPVYRIENEIENNNFSMGHGWAVQKAMNAVKGNPFLNGIRLRTKRIMGL